ncbi:Ig-like domain-containing protein [Bradyrhizobium sp. 172]|uniref:Ig-like domain-containing protein n=1 Tax=Bradyrhizobium sp. 172 TaxID=2782643 RepID=UPI0020003DF7|nr:Ig-like domain-containing protein [Bradyrhizobium sp. 172]UPJ96393.1 VCBS domain-containing protein [Bradyrhizobium sp. 172]
MANRFIFHEGDTFSFSALAGKDGNGNPVPVTITYSTTPGSATPGVDYEPANGSVTSTEPSDLVTNTYQIFDDQIWEFGNLANNQSGENFFGTISNNATINPGLFEAIILDDEDKPTLSVSSVTAAEANSTVNVSIRVTATKAADKPYDITLTLQDEAHNFEEKSIVVTMPAFQTSNEGIFHLIGDTKPELDKSFTVSASTQVGGGLNAASGTITVTNDDWPTVNISPDAIAATEGDDASGVVQVSLSEAAEFPVSIHFSLQPSGFESDVVLTADYVMPAGQTVAGIPVVRALVDDIPEQMESGVLQVTASGDSGSGPHELSVDTNSVALVVKDHVTSADGQIGIADGIAAFKAAVNTFKATVDFALAFDPDNPAVVNIKSNLKIIGDALDGAKIALNFQNLVSVPAVSFSDGVRLVYTDIVNTVVDTFSTFFLKPAAVAIASLSAYEAGLGVGMLVQSLGTEAAVAAVLAGDGALTLTLGLGIASATTVAVAASPFLLAAGAGWAAKIAYDEMSSESKDELKGLLLDYGTNVGQGFQDAFETILNPAFEITPIDGYLVGATVFADSNENGSLDQGELSATVDTDGRYFLASSPASTVAYGGFDSATGLAFKGHLSAPLGYSVVSPLTTLVRDLQSKNVELPDQKVLGAFGLLPSLSLSKLDPIAATKSGDADGAAVYVAGAKVYDTVEMIASALAGAGAAFTHTLQTAFSALASALNGPGISLSDKTALSALITQVAQTESISLASGVADAVASIIAAGNAALDHVVQTEQPGPQLLNDVAGIELVMQGAASSAITDAAGNLTQLQAIANLFTGTNLSELISQAQIEVQNPDQDLGPIAFDGSASTDQNTVLNGMVSAVDLTGDSITYGLDGAAPAGLTFNSDGTFSFDPKDAFKYLALGESTNLSFQFKALDDQGAVDTATETIAINGLNDDPTATADSNGVARGKTLSVSTTNGVLANDSDPDLNDHLAVVAVDGKASAVGHAIKGEYGSLILNADGSYTYVANHGHHHVDHHHGHAHHHGNHRHSQADDHGVAQDVFEYSVSDGHGGLSSSSLSFVVFDKGTTYLSGVDTTLTAGKGSYILDGSASGDTLIASKSGNVLIGGPGDTLIGEKGDDTFLFRPNFGVNTIKNFDLHEDTLLFDHITFSSVRDTLAHTADTALGAMISDGHGDMVTLVGIKAAQLHVHDFNIV